MLANQSGSVLFGAAYYHEYQPAARLDEDLDLMVEAGFTVIRVGEATWSRWEPEDGVFDLDWMEPVLDGAYQRNMRVVIGTPTFAVPMWLVRKYPDIAIENPDGQRKGWGGREEADYTHPAFKFHAERVTRRILKRYASHPAVVGYQVHNEPGLHFIYNSGAVEGFRDYLRHKYETVSRLNDEWGLTFWSHELSDWSDIWHPRGNTLPQYDLAWRRYQANLTSDFVRWLGDVVRSEAKPGQFVTSDISLDRPALHEGDVAESLDVLGINPYYLMQEGFAFSSGSHSRQSWYSTPGPWAMFLSGDRGFASKEAPFYVFETNANAIGGPADNYPAYDGQWRQAAWALVGRGAEMIEYWHWHTLHYGTETYWGGVIPHDQKPGRAFNEIASIGKDLKKAGDRVLELTPDSDLAMLLSVDSKWGLSFQPFRTDGPDHPHFQRNERAYMELFEAYYEGAFRAGAQVKVVHDSNLIGRVSPQEFVANNPILVVPGLYVASDTMLEWLHEYVEGGGHVVLGIRSAYADEEARPRTATKPAGFDITARVSYNEFSNLFDDLKLVPVHDAFPLSAESRASAWVDGLSPEGAETIVGYDHPHFGRWAAITDAKAGNGRVSVVGTVPNAAFAADLFKWLVPAPMGGKAMSGGSFSSVVHSAVNKRGQRLYVVHNFDWEESVFEASVPLEDVLEGTSFEPGDQIRLSSWDVKVFSAPIE